MLVARFPPSRAVSFAQSLRATDYHHREPDHGRQKTIPATVNCARPLSQQVFAVLEIQVGTGERTITGAGHAAAA